MRFLSCLLLMGALAGCGGDDGPGGDGGAADAPGGSVDGGAPDAASGPDATPCNSCMDILNGMGNPPLCEGSQALFEALNACTCTGACAAVCSANVCMGGMPSSECVMCLQNTSTGCGNEYSACSMD